MTANIIKVSAMLTGSFAAYFFGPIDALVLVLTAAVVIDYISGVAAAWHLGELSSKTGFVGLLKKLLIFGLVAVAALVDKICPIANSAISASVCMFYIANECISIFENAGKLGIKLPAVLTRAVKQLKED